MTQPISDERKPRRGWGFPLNSRKAHYFDDSFISVCGRWMFSGALEESDEPSADDCASCSRVLSRAKRRGAV